MLCLFTNINISYCYITIYGQQSRLEDNELSLRRSYKAGKSPWQTVDRVVEQCIDSTHQRIVAIIYIVLVWFPTVLWVGLIPLADRHQPDVGVEGEIGSVPLVIKPVASDNAYGTLGFLDILDYLS